MITQYKIIATKEQLESIGISYDIRNLVGVSKKIFNDGYHVLEITYNNGMFDFKNDYDIPTNFLKKI